MKIYVNDGKFKNLKKEIQKNKGNFKISTSNPLWKQLSAYRFSLHEKICIAEIDNSINLPTGENINAEIVSFQSKEDKDTILELEAFDKDPEVTSLLEKIIYKKEKKLYEKNLKITLNKEKREKVLEYFSNIKYLQEITTVKNEKQITTFNLDPSIFNLRIEIKKISIEIFYNTSDCFCRIYFKDHTPEDIISIVDTKLKEILIDILDNDSEKEKT